MIRVYARHSTGVRTVKRQEPSDRSHNRRGRRDFDSDSVHLGTKEVSEEQIFEILRERIAHYLGEELAAAGVEPGLEPDVLHPRGEPHEALAFSVLSFAKGKLGGFKEAYPLLQDEEARVQLATLVVTAVDKAVEEVLQFAKELIDFLDGGNLESIEKFRETLFGALGDYVGSGHRTERAK